MQPLSILIAVAAAVTGALAQAQDEGACVSSCSERVASDNSARLQRCVSATRAPPARCLCKDRSLRGDMLACFESSRACGAAFPDGRCAATFLDGTIESAFLDGPDGGSAVITDFNTPAAAVTLQLPNVDIPQADQTACIVRCSQQATGAQAERVRACVSATGRDPAFCSCEDQTLRTAVQQCFAQNCPALQNRCAAIVGSAFWISATLGAAPAAPGAPSAPSIGGQSSGAGAQQKDNGIVLGSQSSNGNGTAAGADPGPSSGGSAGTGAAPGQGQGNAGNGARAGSITNFPLAGILLVGLPILRG